jgi:hypothetical protein
MAAKATIQVLPGQHRLRGRCVSFRLGRGAAGTSNWEPCLRARSWPAATKKGSVAMTTWTSMLAALLLTASSAAALAADLKDMVGTWRFRDFTIEVRECDSASLCAKVAAGPKNVGKELFASKLVAKGGELFGQIAHPETQEMYNTRFQQKDKDRWQLDGCTAAKVCLTGEFVRVK